MLHTRLANELDKHIVEYQFGFRAGRSSSQPVYITRRLMDIAEYSGSSLYLLALDLEKAFDSIPHHVLIPTLARYGIPPRLFRLIQNIYTLPTFRVKLPFGLSSEHVQASGIKQGCPLSPFLFILCTSAMFKDILHDYTNHSRAYPMLQPVGMKHPALLFADDVLLTAKNHLELQRLLDVCLVHFHAFNLRINPDKSQMLILGPVSGTVRLNNVPIPPKQEITYLGSILRADTKAKPVLLRVLALATVEYKKLQLFWSTRCSTSWKLIDFYAVLRSKIAYLLEHLTLIPSLLVTLDAFFYKVYEKLFLPLATIDEAPE
eukprot:2780033-Amphidinium_carterae.1